MHPGTLVLLRPDNTEERIELPDEPTLERLQEAVGGYIEMIAVDYPDTRPSHAFVNEEGLLRHLPINRRASALCINGHRIVGTMAIWLGEMS